MIIYFFWFLAVVLWNFGFPKASPLEDVLIAILLALLIPILKKYFKN